MQIRRTMAMLACIAVADIAIAAPQQSPPLAVAARIDGPAVDVDTKQPGRGVRVEFSAKAGDRIDIGVRNLGFTPASASSLLFTVVQPDGTELPLVHRMRCRASVAANAPADCGGSFTVAKTGKHKLEIEAPFSAAPHFALLMSHPIRGALAVDRPQMVNMTRTGQSSVLELPLSEGQEVSISVRDTTTGGGRRAFVLRARKPDGALAATATGDSFQGASLSVSGTAGRYTVEIAPADGATGAFEVSARTGSSALAVDGPPVPFASATPGEETHLGFTAKAGQTLFVVVDDIAQQPEAPSDRMQAMMKNSGGRVSVATLDGKVLQGRGCLPQKQFPGMDCKIALGTLAESGRYMIGIQPQPGITVSGQVYVAQEVVADVTLPVSVHIGPLKPGQVVRYRFKATAGQNVGVDFTQVAIAPGRGNFTVGVHGPDGFPGRISMTMGSTAHFEPFAVSASGTYYVTLDPGAGAIVSADLSVVPR